MMCDMCGKETQLFRARIEEVEMDVCESCARHGEIVRKLAPPEPPKQKGKQQRSYTPAPVAPRKELVESIVEDYGERVKNKREALGLKQDQLAAKLAERVSVISKVETRQHEPDLALARKLERFLHIKLVETTELEEETPRGAGGKQEGMTLGDLVSIKRRK